MATICRFAGIDITMTAPLAGKDVDPFITVRCGEEEGRFDVESGDMLDGSSLSRRPRQLVQGWIELHRDELHRDWIAMTNGGEWFTIDGLH